MRLRISVVGARVGFSFLLPRMSVTQENINNDGFLHLPLR